MTAPSEAPAAATTTTTTNNQLPAMLITATQLLENPLPQLKEDGANLHAWKILVDSRLSRFGLLRGFQTKSLTEDQMVNVLDFLLSVIDYKVINHIMLEY